MNCVRNVAAVLLNGQLLPVYEVGRVLGKVSTVCAARAEVKARARTGRENFIC
jgi:hypothetical protein